MYLKSVVLIALGVALAPLCQAGLKFHVKEHYLSKDLTQTVGDASLPVPMIWNKATDQVIRILPMNTLNPPVKAVQQMDTAPAADNKQEKVVTNYNIFQAFNAELKLRRQKFLGPAQCAAFTLDVFYDESVSTTTSTSSSSATVSSEDLTSYLSYGCPFQATVLNYPCLGIRCSVADDNDELLKTVTISTGVTYLLYGDHLVSIDANCHQLNVTNFHIGTDYYLGVDMIVDEAAGYVIVGFDGLFIGTYNMLNLNLVLFDTAFDDPAIGDFYIVPSALSLPSVGAMYARVYYLGSLYVLAIPFAAPMTMIPESEVCHTNVAFPTVIPDYKHHQDLVVSRENNSLLIVVNNLVTMLEVGSTCYSAKLPACVTGEVVAFTGAKKPECNSFFISFTPSLDMVHVVYETVA